MFPLALRRNPNNRRNYPVRSRLHTCLRHKQILLLEEAGIEICWSLAAPANRIVERLDHIKRKDRLTNYFAKRSSIYSFVASGKLERKDRVHSEEGLARSAVFVES